MDSQYNIADIVQSLDKIAEAVRRNDETQYLEAVSEARQRECTEEQIRDAFDYPAHTQGKFPDFKVAPRLDA